MPVDRWQGLEALEPRLLLSGTILAWGDDGYGSVAESAAATAMLASADEPPTAIAVSHWAEDTSVGSTQDWRSITSNDDGTQLAAAVNGGNIWTSIEIFEHSGEMNPEYTLTIADIPATPGDLDGDGDVDFQDFSVMAFHFTGTLVSSTGGKTHDQGDSDGDGDVDFGDFSVLAANFTGTIAQGQTDVGSTITLTASYTDGQGAAESMTSDSTAAAAANLNNVVFTADPDLILQDNEANRQIYDNLLPCAKTPCLAIFQRGEKKLIFLASSHSLDINSPSHKLAERAFEEFDVEVAILEGFDTGEPLPPVEHMQAACSVGSSGCAEQVYSLLLAYTSYGSEIPAVGGEPSKAIEYEAIRNAGFGKSEYLYFISLRVIDALVNRENRPIDSALVNDFEMRLQGGIDQIPSLRGTIFNFEDFKSIYQSSHNKQFEWHDNVTLQRGWDAPSEHTLFGNIKNTSLDARERNLLQVQAEQLNNFNTVFVVYGSGHLFLELRQHQEWFGGISEVIYLESENVEIELINTDNSPVYDYKFIIKGPSDFEFNEHWKPLSDISEINIFSTITNDLTADVAPGELVQTYDLKNISGVRVLLDSPTSITLGDIAYGNIDVNDIIDINFSILNMPDHGGDFQAVKPFTLSNGLNGDIQIIFSNVPVVANQAPTAIALTNAVTSLAEDADTSSATKMGDIVITDADGGTNEVTLSGPDAASFDVVGSELRLRTDVTLDYETKNRYAVTLTTGSVSVDYTLAIADIPATPGDLDGDGDVDFQDFSVMAFHFTGTLVPSTGGKTHDQGDSDGDGDVDFGDFSVLAANFTGTITGPIAQGQTPRIGGVDTEPQGGGPTSSRNLVRESADDDPDLLSLLGSAQPLALGHRSSVNSSDQSYASRIAGIAHNPTGLWLTNSLFGDSDDQIEPAFLQSFLLVNPLRIAL